MVGREYQIVSQPGYAVDCAKDNLIQLIRAGYGVCNENTQEKLLSPVQSYEYRNADIVYFSLNKDGSEMGSLSTRIRQNIENDPFWQTLQSLLQKEIDAKKFYDAHLLLKHRGPDDEGFVIESGGVFQACKGDDTMEYFQNLPHIRNFEMGCLALAHRRLAIIDLTHRAHQPLSDEKREYWIVYNGEVYNFAELKKELEGEGFIFSSNSDTEVVLKVYMHWGIDGFKKFIGMWAFAIYDKKQNRIVLSRDRFGMKPLFYSFQNGVLYFASEIKFIKAFARAECTLNNIAVTAYLKDFSVNYSEETFWNEIKILEPGKTLVFQNSSLHIQSYWDYEPKTNARCAEGEALERFAYLFEDSLKLCMVADVKVGGLLSGGLDSSTIVGALHKLGLVRPGDFHSFSAVFAKEHEQEFSEKKYIEEMARMHNFTAHFVYPQAEKAEE
jgi:asparagine synthase (glutamine-hydrolysing)